MAIVRAHSLLAGNDRMESFINNALLSSHMNEQRDIERAVRARKRIRQNLQDIERKLDHLLLRIREADDRINAGMDEWDLDDPDEEA